MSPFYVSVSLYCIPFESKSNKTNQTNLLSVRVRILFLGAMRCVKCTSDRSASAARIQQAEARHQQVATIHSSTKKDVKQEKKNPCHSQFHVLKKLQVGKIYKTV